MAGGVEGVAEQRDLARRAAPARTCGPSACAATTAAPARSRPRPAPRRAPPRPRPRPWCRSRRRPRSRPRPRARRRRVGIPSRASRARAQPLHGQRQVLHAQEQRVVEQHRRAVAAAAGVDLDDVGAEPGRGRDALERVLGRVARTGPVRDDERVMDEGGHGSGATRTSAASVRYDGLGRADLVGPQQVGHDPQHPLHEGAALHPDPGQLAHHRRVADGPHEHARHLEVEAVDLLEAGVVGLQREPVARGQGRDRRRRRRAGRSRTRPRCPRR